MEKGRSWGGVQKGFGALAARHWQQGVEMTGSVTVDNGFRKGSLNESTSLEPEDNFKEGLCAFSHKDRAWSWLTLDGAFMRWLLKRLEGGRLKLAEGNCGRGRDSFERGGGREEEAGAGARGDGKVGQCRETRASPQGSMPRKLHRRVAALPRMLPATRNPTALFSGGISRIAFVMSSTSLRQTGGKRLRVNRLGMCAEMSRIFELTQRHLLRTMPFGVRELVGEGGYL